jgi:tetratricopeptide (TPR) repeat protein
VLELNPELLPARQILGFALLARGYAAEAIPHLTAAHDFGALGIAQLQNGQPDEAVENLRRALNKNPGDPDLLFYLGKASSALSEQSLDNLLSTYPDSPRAHQALGENYYTLKMYGQAAKEFNEALSLRPDLPGLRLELGQLYADSSDWDKAEEQFRAEAALEPGNAEVAYRLGDALLQQGKMNEAAAELKRSDDLRPNMSETLYCLGKATAVSNPVAAEKALAHVIELEKDSLLSGQAYLLLASIHRKQGKTDEASTEMQEFRRIQSLRRVEARKP